MPLGTMALDQGDIEGADALLRAGLQIYLELEFDAALPLAFEQFAAVAVARGDASHAVQLAAAGAAWREKLCTNPTPYTPWLVAHLAAAHVAVDPGALMAATCVTNESSSVRSAIAEALGMPRRLRSRSNSDHDSIDSR